MNRYQRPDNRNSSDQRSGISGNQQVTPSYALPTASSLARSINIRSWTGNQAPTPHDPTAAQNSLQNPSGLVVSQNSYKDPTTKQNTVYSIHSTPAATGGHPVVQLNIKPDVISRLTGLFTALASYKTGLSWGLNNKNHPQAPAYFKDLWTSATHIVEEVDRLHLAADPVIKSERQACRDKGLQTKLPGPQIKPTTPWILKAAYVNHCLAKLREVADAVKSCGEEDRKFWAHIMGVDSAEAMEVCLRFLYLNEEPEDYTKLPDMNVYNATTW